MNKIDRNDINLIRYQVQHIEAIQSIASIELNTQSTNTPWPYPSNGAKEFQKICESNWNNNISKDFVIELNGKVIGNCAIVGLDTEEKLIGYMISNEYWNLGIGKIVVSMLVNICKDELNLTEVYAPVLVENMASQKILLSNGFEFVNEFMLPNDYPKFPNRKMNKYKKVV